MPALYLHKATRVNRKKILLLISGLLLSGAFLITCSKTKSNAPVYATNCADSLIGVYVGSDYCSSSSQPSYSCSITAATPTNITFSNLSGALNVNGIIDCSKNTISIPSQTFPGNFSISGTGTYTANRIIINWSGLSLGSPVNCSTTFTR
jgi:hypothetical protein